MTFEKQISPFENLFLFTESFILFIDSVLPSPVNAGAKPLGLYNIKLEGILASKTVIKVICAG